MKLSISLLFTVTACGGGNGTKSQLDVTAPVITLLGDVNVTVIKNSTYIDAGATATDDIDGVVNVITDGKVDPKKLGEYLLTYTATDVAGNTAKKTRMVTVAPDSTAPMITILGENPAEVYQGGVYIEAGVTVIDEIDGELETTISGAVDTSMIGSYTLTYSATDLSGNVASSIRVVNVVVDPSRKLVTSIDFPDASLKQCVDSDDNNYIYADEFLTLNCSFYGIEN